MALIKCPDCGKKVSDRAQICPECGFPIQEEVTRLKKVLWTENLVQEISENGYDEEKLVSLLKDCSDESYVKEILSLIEQYNPDSLNAEIYRWAMENETNLNDVYALYEDNLKYYLSEEPAILSDEQLEKPIYPKLRYIEAAEEIGEVWGWNLYEKLISCNIVGSQEAIQKVLKSIEFLRKTRNTNSFYLVKFDDEENSIHLGDLSFSREETIQKLVVDKYQIQKNQVNALVAQLKFSPTDPKKPMTMGSSALAGAVIGGPAGAIVGAAIGQSKNQEYLESLKRGRAIRDELEKERAETLAALQETPMKLVDLERYYFAIALGNNVEVELYLDQDETVSFDGEIISAQDFRYFFIDKKVRVLYSKLRAIRNKMRDIYLTTGDYVKAFQYGETEESKIRYEQELEKKEEEIRREEQEKDRIYQQAKDLMEENDKEALTEARSKFQSLGDWKDAAQLNNICEEKILEIDNKVADEEKKKRREEQIRTEKAETTRQKWITRIALIVFIMVTFVFVLDTVIVPNSKYENAVKLKETGEYKQALEEFRELGDYRNAEKYVEEIAYDLASEAENAGELKCAAVLYGMCYNNSLARDRSVELWNKLAIRRKEDVGCYYSILLNENGTVTYSGKAIGGDEGISEWNDLCAVAGGGWITAGLKKDGTVVAISDFDMPELRLWKDIVAIAVGNNAIAGLKMDGTVLVTGQYGMDEQKKVVSEWEDIVAIDVSDGVVFGLKLDGTVVSTYTKMESISNVAQIAAGSEHAVALKEDGTVEVIMGYNAEGECEISEWTDIVAVAAGHYVTYGVKSDGTVVYAGGKSYSNHFETVLEWENIVTISADYLQVIGRCSDGSVLELVYDNE